jgi:AraC-like DNA-binding protein
MHRHTSAEFLIRGRWKRVGEFILPDEKRAVLPLVIPPCQLSGEVFQLIRRIAIAHNTDERRTYFEECADFMGLIHKLCTVAAFCEKKSLSPAGGRYCRRAKDYVSLNIDKKLTVKEIAEYVGVSRNYLTNLFTANEGVSLIEYVNRRKLAYMVELIRRYGYTLQQAGLHVGFTDVNYISRIFRQYYGMTFVEFKRTELGIKDK